MPKSWSAQDLNVLNFKHTSELLHLEFDQFEWLIREFAKIFEKKLWALFNILLNGAAKMSVWKVIFKGGTLVYISLEIKKSKNWLFY